MLEALAILQTAPIDQLPETANAAPWGESIADEVMWVGLFSTVFGLGRRYLAIEALPDDLSGFDPEAAIADRDGRDRWRAWALYAVAVLSSTAGVYLLTTLAWTLLWFGAAAFVGAVVALWAYRSGTPLDDFRMLIEARRQGDAD